MSSLVILSLSLQISEEEPSLLLTIIHQHLLLNNTVPIDPRIFRFNPGDMGFQVEETDGVLQFLIILQMPHHPARANFEPLNEALREYNFPVDISDRLIEIVKLIEEVDFSPMPWAPRVLMIQSANLSSLSMETMRSLLVNVYTPPILIDTSIGITLIIQACDLSTIPVESQATYIVESSNFLDWPMDHLYRIVASLAAFDGASLVKMMLQILSKFESKPSEDEDEGGPSGSYID